VVDMWSMMILTLFGAHNSQFNARINSLSSLIALPHGRYIGLLLAPSPHLDNTANQHNDNSLNIAIILKSGGNLQQNKER